MIRLFLSLPPRHQARALALIRLAEARAHLRLRDLDPRKWSLGQICAGDLRRGALRQLRRLRQGWEPRSAYSEVQFHAAILAFEQAIDPEEFYEDPLRELGVEPRIRQGLVTILDRARLPEVAA